jgi:signal transduction histidine kinase
LPQNNRQVSRERIIEIEALPKDGAVYLSVEDWGCGIEPEIMDKIFQPFFTTKGADMGTGIGLSLTKNVVERDFGGEIKCESEANNGSKFTVILPIKGK